MKIFLRFAVVLGTLFLLVAMSLWPSWSVATAAPHHGAVSSATLISHPMRPMAQITFTPVATVYLPF